MKLKLKILLIFIILGGFLLRFMNVSNNPPALYGDELTLVYDAYSILLTGQDQTGQFLPLIFKLGDHRPPLYVYSTIPFVILLGPSIMAARLLSIISGTMIIFLIFWLGKKFFNLEVALFASFLVTINPWAINLSRAGFETNYALFLALLGLVFFIKGLDKSKYFILSVLLFCLTLFTYPTYKLTTPLFLLLLLFIFKRFQNVKNQLKDKNIIFSLIILITFLTIFLFQVLIGGSEDRFLKINIFQDEEISQKFTQEINYQRNIASKNSEEFISLFHNKYEKYLNLYLSNYLNHFSTSFLFVSGDSNPRHNMTMSGQFYLIEFISILSGLIYCFNKFKNKFTLLIGWLIIAPMATSLISPPHALRSSFLLPPLIFLSALGFYSIYRVKKIRLLLICLAGFMILQSLITFERLFFISGIKYANFWSTTARRVSELADRQKSKYNYIFISDKIDNIQYAYPVYAKIDPNQVISQNQNQSVLNSLKFNKYDNIYIGSIPQKDIENFVQNINGRVLFIGTSEEKQNLQGVSIQKLNPLNDEQDIVIKEK